MKKLNLNFDTFWKPHLCKLIQNSTQSRMITTTTTQGFQNKPATAGVHWLLRVSPPATSRMITNTCQQTNSKSYNVLQNGLFTLEISNDGFPCSNI